MAENRLFAALAYVFGWLSGLIVFLISKDDKLARFHGMQAILFNIGYVVGAIALIIFITVLSIIVGIIAAATNIGALGLLSLALWLVFAVYGLGCLALWVWAIWQAFNGNMYKMPVIGNFAERWA